MNFKKHRIITVIGMFVYLTGCSAFFAAVFTMKHLFIGLAGLAIAQLFAAYIVWLVVKTGKYY